MVSYLRIIRNNYLKNYLVARLLQYKTGIAGKEVKFLFELNKRETALGSLLVDITVYVFLCFFKRRFYALNKMRNKMMNLKGWQYLMWTGTYFCTATADSKNMLLR